jgi:NADPH2:quinone reductase
MPRQSNRAARPAIPASMKAAAIARFGPPSVLTLHTLPVPQPGPREILIAVHTAGVGSWDDSIRDGSWKPPGRSRFPLVPGTDGAGIVAAKGSRVTRFRIGDRAYAYAAANAKGGFYAEYVAIDERKAGQPPDRLDLVQAGGGAATGLTALQGIDRVLKVRKGETVLVFGASGAVGTLAVQFARRRGCRVLATASGLSASRLIRRPKRSSTHAATTRPIVCASWRQRASTPCLRWLAETSSSAASISCATEDESHIPTASNPNRSPGAAFAFAGTT